MNANPLAKVLALLRLIREPPGVNSTPRDMLQNWLGGSATGGQLTRAAAYVQEVAATAEEYVEASSLPEDARRGLGATLKGLSAAFEPGHFSTTISSHVRAIDESISSFSILLTAAGLADTPRPTEVVELVEAVQQMLRDIQASDLDPNVKVMAVRHLQVLLLLLSHIEAFGVDGARIAYAELVVRLQSAAKVSSEPSRLALTKLWPEFERWAGRLAIIEAAIENGQSVVTQATSLMALLPGYVS